MQVSVEQHPSLRRQLLQRHQRRPAPRLLLSAGRGAGVLRRTDHRRQSEPETHGTELRIELLYGHFIGWSPFIKDQVIWRHVIFEH